MASGKKRSHIGSDWCSAINCSNARGKESCQGMSFYEFPWKNAERCREWIQRTRRKDMLGKSCEEIQRGGYKLCSVHFELSQFTNPNAERKRLVWNALPSIFNIKNRPKTVTPKRKIAKRHVPEVSTPAKKPRQDGDLITVPGASTYSSKDATACKTPCKNTEKDITEVNETSFGKKNRKPPSSPKKLKKKIKLLQNQLYRAKNKLKRVEAKQKCKTSDYLNDAIVFDYLKKTMPQKNAEFVIDQIESSRKHDKGKRYGNKLKLKCLSLLNTSKKNYLAMKQFCLLPSIETLKKSVRKLNIHPGFDDKIFSAIEYKLKNMPSDAKLCSIVFDEMSIKENLTYDIGKDEIEGLEDFGLFCQKSRLLANHATVFMARGLISNWKQPLGYFLSHGPIKSNLLSRLITSCVSKLSTCGLDVKCVVADQGSNNRKAFSNLHVSETCPYFLVDGKRILVFYDPPHLLKNIRNNLKKSGFESDAGFIRWKYIIDFYNYDKKSSVRMAPKLSDKHLTLPPFSKLKVKLATQVLSHSVATGISFLANKFNDKDANATAVFIENFDRLFNAFNSRNLHCPRKMGHALGEKSGHIAFLKDMLKWLDKVKSCSPRQLYCLSGWKLSIHSLLLLWDDLSSVHNVSFLCTRRLNQDCIENLFSRIRGHCSRVTNPTASEFRSFFKNVLIDALHSHSKGSNCEDDDTTFLLSFDNVLSSVPMDQDEFDHVQIDNNDKFAELTEVNTSTDEIVQLIKANVITYIAGYITKKISIKICSTCADALSSGPSLTNVQKTEFLKLKQIDGDKLTMPSESLRIVVSDMEDEYCSVISPILHTPRIKSRLMEKLKVKCTPFTCTDCNTNDLILKLFINIRLHFTLKVFNNSICKKFEKSNRAKLIIVNHK